MHQILKYDETWEERRLNWTVEDTIAWMQKANEYMQHNKQSLTRLDQAIGDGDHGINMTRGFQAVVDKLSVTTYTSVSELLKDIAMTLLSNVGGASGPLYGTVFLRMSFACKNKERIDQTVWTKGLLEAVSGIKQRGKASFGEKTLLDVWEPVATYMKENEQLHATHIREVAHDALETTRERLATKGRAAYLKERSIGHLDPGAMSSYYIIRAFTEVLEGGNKS